MTEFLLLHGYGDEDNDRWQNHLQRRLEAEGAKVNFPNLPNRNTRPQLMEWRKIVEAILTDVDLQELVVAGHSLGSTLWHHLMAGSAILRSNIKRVFLVATPRNDCGIDAISNFYPLPPLELEAEARDRHLMIYSDDDPYIRLEEFKVLSQHTKIPSHLIQGAKHFIHTDGYGQWSWMEDQCLKLL
jgi:predicted alpha/beta hydrolase family esterase